MAQLSKRRKNRVVIELTTNREITQKQACQIVKDIMQFGKQSAPLLVSGWPRYQDVKILASKVKEGERVIVGAAAHREVESFKPMGTQSGRFSSFTPNMREVTPTRRLSQQGMSNIQNLPRDANNIMQQILRLYTREEITQAIQWAISAEKIAR